MLSDEEVAVVEGGGGELDDDVVGAGGGVGDVDGFEGIVDGAGFAVYLADCYGFGHFDGLLRCVVEGVLEAGKED